MQMDDADLVKEIYVSDVFDSVDPIGSSLGLSSKVFTEVEDGGCRRLRMILVEDNNGDECCYSSDEEGFDHNEVVFVPCMISLLVQVFT
ncbi:hypothetical protein L6452_34234 [Arctium lappa]|uniref:Uncharacterized protein n=1 Tax=Arctium lappa TaxID=4217 RepID=A0ACB8YHW3_ARCLA|nr:hypothetical protein L6452_34234 [Arctium lappa]